MKTTLLFWEQRNHVILDASSFYDKDLNLLMGEGNCYFRALYNQQAYSSRGLKLKLVHGSLAYRKKNGKFFFELGNPEYKTLKDFLNPKYTFRAPAKEGEGKGKIFSVDIHTWLEDDEGRVYDIYEPYFDELDNSDVKGFRAFDPIESINKDHLKEYHGLWYVPAPGGTISATQSLLDVFMHRTFYQDYLTYMEKNKQDFGMSTINEEEEEEEEVEVAVV